MKALVNSESQQEYDDHKASLLETLDNDKENLLYKSFMAYWDNTTDGWVMFKRGTVPHLKNNTNNRLETKWGKIKDVVDASVGIDELISMLITMQECAEERYLADFHRVGSRPPINEDPELAALSLQLSEYAFKMVEKQFELAVGPRVDYEVNLDTPGQANITSPSSGNMHVVDTRTCLLPCRHVMYFRWNCNDETVVPPMRTFSTRWIVRNPVNNIGEGDVGPGGLNRVTCASTPVAPAVTSSTRYSQSKEVADKIVEVMSMQSSPTYRLGLKWLKGFYSALHAGDLDEFTGQVPIEPEGFANLSQVSPVGDIEISQLSFTSEVKGPTPVTPVTPAVEQAEQKEEDEEKPPAPVQLPPPEEPATEAGTEQTPIAFASPPRQRGMTRRQMRKTVSARDLKDARVLANKICEGKKIRAIKLDGMEILTGPYSFHSAKPIVDKLPLPSVEVTGAVTVRPFNVGEDVPVITAIPQLEKVREAIEAIEVKQNVDLLARFEDYGYATLDQLDLMKCVIEARKHFRLMQFVLNWVAKVEYRVDKILPPFKDTQDVVKADYLNAVTRMNLGVTLISGEAVPGSFFLEFRENLWLHTTSIIAGLMVMKDTYAGVGVANPQYHDFAALQQKRRVAAGYGADQTEHKKIISIINLGHHWGAFMVDKETKRCYVFDPLQLQSNITTIMASVRSTIEPMLHMTDKLQYKVISRCRQQDSSSCGVWCLAVLELLLHGVTDASWDSYWNDSLYDVLDYLRLRYLYKVIRLQKHVTILDE